MSSEPEPHRPFKSTSTGTLITEYTHWSNKRRAAQTDEERRFCEARRYELLNEIERRAREA